MKPKAYSYIRFSTKEQAKGDSERRQSDPDKKIAEKLKLPLDDTLHLTDRGLSGYTGDNLTKGALGEFIKLVDEGKIAVGSVLIMENLDRLTRLPVLEAQNLLTGILLRGIGIYTWMDGKLLNKETFDISDSILSSINLDQGNKEVAKKKQRILDGWETIRKDVIKGKRKISINCPLWLKPIPDPDILKKESKFVTIDFEPIEERVKTIKLIFKMKLEGKGSDKIVRELNNMKGIWIPEGKIINVETKERKHSEWYISLVEHYLKNRRLLGELQLYRYSKVNGKRINTPEGDPIQYYPPVIDKELFNQVQKIISDNSKRDGRGGGRSDLVNNLFSHMAVCAHCNSAMRYQSKGDPKLHGKVQLKCTKIINHLKCDSTTLFYKDVEDAVLKFCKGLEVAIIMPNKATTLSELSKLKNQLQAKNGEIEIVTEILKNKIKDTDKPMSYEFKKALGESYDIKKSELDKLNTEKINIEKQIRELSNNDSQTQEQINSIKELIDLMNNLRKDVSKKQELLSIRLSLRTQLRQLIKKINVSAKHKTVLIFFQTGQRRAINLVTSKMVDAYPKKIFNKV